MIRRAHWQRAFPGGGKNVFRFALMSAPPLVRRATPDDVSSVHTLIRELAVFEKLEHEVVATEEATRSALFGPSPCAEALLAEVDGEAVGFALFYPFYSTFAGRCGLYLEDVYVREAHRRGGCGRGLMEGFLARARELECPKVEWRVLTWNDGAIRFYESLGATVLRDWVPVRMGLARAPATSGSE
jgi:GNAT superfamily N-acetyltransferase